MARKQPGYWNKETIIRELEDIMKENELDYVPPAKFLRKIGRDDVVDAVERVLLGFRELRELMNQSQLRKKPGYWKDIENVAKELIQVMETYNFKEVPSENDLEKIDRTDISNGIKDHHGMYKIREYMHSEELKKPAGYWMNIDNVVMHLKYEMKKHNLKEFPTQEVLMKIGRSDLFTAINRHFGYPKIRKYMNVEQPYKPAGYWTIDKVVEEIKEVVDKNELKNFPSSDKLRKLGIYHLNSAVGRLKCGWAKVREQYNERYNPDFEKFKTKWDLDSIVEELRKIMEEHQLEKVPGADKLKQLGYSYLSSAVDRLKCGWKKVREYYDEKMGVLPEKQQLESLLEGYAND